MPETRVVETVYGLGGYDPTKPNNNIIEEITAEISDEQLLLEQLAGGANNYHTLAIQAFNNWGSLTLAQKDIVLKFLLGYYLTSAQRLGYFTL